MSQSILYQCFGIKGVTYRSTNFIGNAVIINVETKNRYVPCNSCSHKDSNFKGQKLRRFKMPPIGRKQAVIQVTMHRLQCKKCGHIWWPPLPFVDGQVRYTRSFALTALDMLKFATIKAVADYLHVSWNVIKEIHKRKLSKLYRHISLSKVKYLGVDEFSIRKNHRYMTVFVDLQSGRILHAVEGRSKDNVSPFLKRVKRSAKKLKAISMDMSVSYSSAVKEILPDIPIVFDRYHIMAIMNRHIDDLRRELQRSLGDEEKKYIKGNRFLLLKNYDKIEADDRQRLDILLHANAPLYEIHTMKEQLRLFWEQDSQQKGVAHLVHWILDAIVSDVKQLNKMANTLINHLLGIIEYYPHKITNGLLEGLNNKIKTMKRQAYGFRDMEYFKLRLYDLHTDRYAFK
jgi:transposase